MRETKANVYATMECLLMYEDYDLTIKEFSLHHKIKLSYDNFLYFMDYESDIYKYKMSEYRWIDSKMTIKNIDLWNGTISYFTINTDDKEIEIALNENFKTLINRGEKE